MHAWWALQRGDEVVQIECDAEARSASVRNFGLVWVSGRRDGAELDLALRARELWEQIGVRVSGLGFRPHGSLTVALDGAEAAAMQAYAAGDGARQRRTEWLDGAGARAVNPAVGGVVAGALWCHSDAIVESRVALAAMRTEMAVNGRYRFIAGRRVRERRGTEVIDHCGERHGGDAVIVCTGAEHDGLDAEHLSAAPLRRCRLQMMQTAPAELSLTTSIADADSMRYYPAYEHLDLSGLAPQPPVAVANRMQLLMVQRLDGSLTIGDTHTYDDDPTTQPFAFDVDEAPYGHLIERAEAILGRSLPPIQRRWAGVYSQLAPTASAGAVYHHGEIEPGVVAVTGPGGRGMTLAPAIAEQTWERLGT